MPTDEQLRVGLRRAVEHLQPNVEAEMSALRNRVRHRRRLRWSGMGAAAAAVLGIIGGLAPQFFSDARPEPASTPQASSLDPTIGPLPSGEFGRVEPLRARTYVVRFDIADYPEKPHAVVEVPDGWGRYDDYLLAGRGRQDGRWLGFWTIARVNTDPCQLSQPEAGWVDPGPGVDDLAQALVDNAVGPASEPEPVRVGGYSGVHLRLTRPTSGTGCYETSPWESETGDRPPRYAGYTDHIWILDVAGERLVIDAFFNAERRRQVDELVRMAKGVTFTNVD
jgi:hypothetical protein